MLYVLEKLLKGCGLKMKLLFGSQNFGYDISTSDKDYLEFVYPTMDDIINNKMTSYEKYNEDGSITKVKDIRLIYQMIHKQNFNDLQFLFSIETHDCEDLQWFFDNRDRLIRYNKLQMLQTNLGFILSENRKGDLKSKLRVMCFSRLIELTMHNNPFTFRYEELGILRENQADDINSDEYVNKVLKVMENYKNPLEIDVEIITEVKSEIARLLLKNFNNNN